VRSEEINKILNRVYRLFKEGAFEDAVTLLEDGLKIDFEDPQIAYALKCANFWLERVEKLAFTSGKYEKAEFLTLQWINFSKFLNQIGESSEKCLFNLKQFIFGTAMHYYIEILEDSDIFDAEILLKIGKCYKAVGNYEKAIEYLVLGNQQKSGCAELLAELGDCYSLINETKFAKLFFREAFFLNPKEIPIESLESGMIKKLVEAVREKEIPDELLNDWIPVFGTIFGVFNIKRELKALEFGKLKQVIFSLEKEVREKTQDVKHMIPKLINHYFWLIDHYINTRDDKSKIEEICAKIKDLDYDVYLEYTQ
jgi:tetratricopeptide (TPR) repeat protein